MKIMMLWKIHQYYNIVTKLDKHGINNSEFSLQISCRHIQFRLKCWLDSVHTTSFWWHNRNSLRTQFRYIQFLFSLCELFRHASRARPLYKVFMKKLKHAWFHVVHNNLICQSYLFLKRNIMKLFVLNSGVCDSFTDLGLFV